MTARRTPVRPSCRWARKGSRHRLDARRSSAARTGPGCATIGRARGGTGRSPGSVAARLASAARLPHPAAAAARLCRGARGVAAVRGVALRSPRRADRFSARSISRGGGWPGRRSTRSRRRSRETMVAAEDQRFARMAGSTGSRSLGALRDRLAGKRVAGRSTLSMQVAGFPRPRSRRAGRARLARQAAPDARRAGARRRVEQGPDPRGLSQPRRLPRRGAGDRRGGARAVRQDARRADPRRRAAARRVAARPAGERRRVARRACALARERDCARFAAARRSMLGPARSLALDPGLAPHLAASAADQAGAPDHHDARRAVQRVAIAALQAPAAGPGRQPRARRRGGGGRQCQRRRARLCRRDRRQFDRAAVDGATAYRQAGSTLKPFLYAQAIEQGYLTAASILDDSPVQLDTASGLYVPQNYDSGFKGPVSARTALAGSLNVPAVRTLLLVGVEAFRDRLWDTGYRGLIEDGEYYGFQPRARLGRGDAARAGGRLSQPGERRALVAAAADRATDPAPAAARDHHAASRVDRRRHDRRSRMRARRPSGSIRRCGCRSGRR